MGHGHHGNLQQIIDQLILFTSDPSVLVMTAMTRRHMESDSGNQPISTHEPSNWVVEYIGKNIHAVARIQYT